MEELFTQIKLYETSLLTELQTVLEFPTDIWCAVHSVRKENMKRVQMY